MYLLQAVSFPPWLGNESDLFQCTQPVREIKIVPADAICGVVVPPSPVALVHSGLERRDKSGPDPSRIVRNRRSFATGGAPWVWEPSTPRGKSVGIIGFDILVNFCALCNYVYFSVCTCYRPYLSRHGSEASRTSSHALSQCRRSRFSPQRLPAASWYHLPRWY